jgi:hypothetical protein
MVPDYQQVRSSWHIIVVFSDGPNLTLNSQAPLRQGVTSHLVYHDDDGPSGSMHVIHGRWLKPSWLHVLLKVRMLYGHVLHLLAHPAYRIL